MSMATQVFCPNGACCPHGLVSGGGGGSSSRRRRGLIRVVSSTEGGRSVEFGARDPFAAEVESNFGEKVLGNQGTDHIILVPNAPAFSLAERSCTPVSAFQPPFTLPEAKASLRKIVGWRLVEEGTCLKLQCDWKLKDHAAGLELIDRVSLVAESEGQPVKLHLDDEKHVVRAEICTEQIGGLCENNFILAAKIDQVKTSDLVKRNKFWA